MLKQRIKLSDHPTAFPWAKTLTEKELERVEAETFACHVQKGELVGHQGEPVEHWNGVIEGLVKLGIGHASGKVTTYIAFAAGGWFGDASLQRAQPRRTYDAIALRDSFIAYVPGPTFLWLQNNNIFFNHFLLRLDAERIFYFFSMFEGNRLLHSTNRVAHCLAGLFNLWLHPGIGTQIDISQEELGNLVGVSRQQVNQALKVLKDAGLVRLEPGRIKVLDLEGLTAFQECGRSAADEIPETESRLRAPRL